MGLSQKRLFKGTQVLRMRKDPYCESAIKHTTSSNSAITCKSFKLLRSRHFILTYFMFYLYY